MTANIITKEFISLRNKQSLATACGNAIYQEKNDSVLQRLYCLHDYLTMVQINSSVQANIDMEFQKFINCITDDFKSKGKFSVLYNDMDHDHFMKCLNTAFIQYIAQHNINLRKSQIVSSCTATNEMVFTKSPFESEFTPTILRKSGDHLPSILQISDSLLCSKLAAKYGNTTTENILTQWQTPSSIRGLRDDHNGPAFSTDCAAIEYCDNENSGVNQHYNAFNTNLMKSLNDPIRAWENTPFGVSNIESDNRLKSRRDRDSSKVLRREARLNKRNLDYTDAPTGIEYDTMLQGYNMDSLKKTASKHLDKLYRG